MECPDVESISESIIREYLSRKGLKQTLQTMDQESPRKNNSISNRSELAKVLNITPLMKKNKSAPLPLRSMLEVMTQDHMVRSDSQDQDFSRGAAHIPSPAKTRNNLNTNSSGRSQYSTEFVQEGSHQSSDHHPRKSPSSKYQVNEAHLTDAGASAASEENGSGAVVSDLVLDDHLEDNETLLGDGKSGVLGQTPSGTDFNFSVSTLPTSTQRAQRQPPGRHRGLSGPIQSSINDREPKRQLRARSGRGAGRPLQLTDNSPALSLGDHSPKNDRILFDTDTKPETNNPPKPRNIDYRQESGSKSRQNDHLDIGIAPNREPERKSDSPESKRLENILSADVNKRLESATKSSRRYKEQFSEPYHQDYDVSDSSVKSGPVPVKKISPRKSEREIRDLLTSGKPAKHKNKFDDLELGDVDDLEDELNDLDLGSRLPVRQPSFVVDSKPLDIKTAVELKTLVFGSAQQNFNNEWRYQSFSFCDLPKLKYGIVQKKGGPCGILACVQACVLQHLLFSSGKPTHKLLDVSRQRRSELLAGALTMILWRAGGEHQALVTLPSMKTHFPGSTRIKTDGLIETLMVNTLTSKEDLQRFILQNIGQFELDGTSGVILALYSAILTRTIEGVKTDMDEPSGKLMGAHGYCTQDMVNLFLNGHAFSNVFNDTVELTGGDDVMVLKGVQGRSDIGLLSLFEHYKSCQVGTYLKTPKYPIWVVCSESHFSVLFSLKTELLRDWKAERRFDLYYYDGLGKQEDEIRLTVDTSNRFFTAPSEDELVPPLEHCIRTKWPDAEIDWNGTDPLL